MTGTGIEPQLTLDLFSAAKQGFDSFHPGGNSQSVQAVKDWSAGRGPDVLYRNTGGAGPTIFEDASTQAGIGGPAPSVAMQATWVDYDHDGDQDLFCVHDSRTLSRLYQNHGFLPLLDVAASARIDTYPTETTCCNMGIAWGDFDGDGWQDAYVTRIGHGGLYRNNADGTFTDVAQERGAARNGMSWGVVFNDFDNDGDPDLFIVSTSGYDGTPTLLYRNEAGAFTEIGAQAGSQAAAVLEELVDFLPFGGGELGHVALPSR